MKFMKNWNLGNILAAFALFVTVCNINTTCIYVVHQPKVPEAAKRLKTQVQKDELAE